MKYFRLDGDRMTECEGDYAALLLGIPNFISKKDRLLPPIEVIKNLIESGSVNAGMSGFLQWEGVCLSSEDIEVLLSRLHDMEYRSVVVPEWVQDRNLWLIWKLEYLHGVPSKQHRGLTDDVERLKRAADVTKKQGESVKSTSLDEKVVSAEMKLADFINSYFP